MCHVCSLTNISSSYFRSFSQFPHRTPKPAVGSQVLWMGGGRHICGALSRCGWLLESLSSTLVYSNTSLVKSSLSLCFHDVDIMLNCPHMLILQLVFFIIVLLTFQDASFSLIWCAVVTRMIWQAAMVFHLCPPTLNPGVQCLLCFVTGHFILCLLLLTQHLNHSFFFFSVDSPLPSCLLP